MGMFTNVRQYAYDRRRGIAILTGVAGGLYMAGKYMLSRLEEMRESVAIERNARDSLRRRFGQNQSDVSFTVLALLPSVGHRILDSMNVERVTLELRSLGAPASKAGSAPSTSAGASAAPTPAPYSVPLPQTPAAVSDDARSESSEMPGSFTAGDPMAESSSSWVDQFNSSQLAEGSGESHNVTNLGDSVAALSVTSEEPSAPSLDSSMLSDSSRAPSRTSDAPEIPTRTKSELWRDLKILSFTRALTLAYTTTLLTLLTATQLTLLGRLKYIRAVHEAASERPVAPRPADGPSSIITDFASSFFGSSAKGASDETEPEPELSEDEERRFLSLSWWLLHDGWRVVAHRVQTAVEGVFEGVSLKTQLSVDDLIVLVRSVHNAIDLSDNFAAAILPPEEHLSRILTLADPTTSPPAAHPAASLPDIPGSNYQQKPALRTASTPNLLADLLEETQARIRGADFALVLQAALTRAEGSLLEGIDAEMYAPLRAAELNKDEEAALQGAFGPPRVREIPEPRARLAALLPSVARWAHTVVGSGYPNDVVENLTRLREVEVYSAIVYGAYDDSLGR